VGICRRHLRLKIAAPAKQGSPHHWEFFKVHTGPRFAQDFQPSVCIRLYNKIVRQQAEIVQNHKNKHALGIGQGKARHRKYMRLKLGGGQAYDLSSD
jgi:hypothetical protein